MLTRSGLTYVVESPALTVHEQSRNHDYKDRDQSEEIDQQSESERAAELLKELYELCVSGDGLWMIIDQLSEGRLTMLESYATNDMFNIRSFILDSVSECQIPSNYRVARNASAHGGNIIGDIDTILQMTEIDPEYTLHWHHAFQRLYGLSYEDNGSFIIDILYLDEPARSTLDQLITVCNIKATTQMIRPWRRHPKFKLMQALCDEIVNDCVKNDFSLEFWDRPYTVLTYKGITTWYEDILFDPS